MAYKIYFLLFHDIGRHAVYEGQQHFSLTWQDSRKFVFDLKQDTAENWG
jgi:hypothetical protein